MMTLAATPRLQLQRGDDMNACCPEAQDLYKDSYGLTERFRKTRDSFPHVRDYQTTISDPYYHGKAMYLTRATLELKKRGLGGIVVRLPDNER